MKRAKTSHFVLLFFVYAMLFSVVSELHEAACVFFPWMNHAFFGVPLRIPISFADSALLLRALMPPQDVLDILEEISKGK